MILTNRAIALLAGSLLLLASCGPLEDSVAGGGIGGTGKGTVSDYGSVIINEIRRFDVIADTEILLDGQSVSEAHLRELGTGLVARLIVGRDVNEDFTRGTALAIAVDHYLIGPVTATSPSLQVLGQTVVVTGDAVLANLEGPVGPQVGSIVQVSGYANADNVIQATRLQFQPEGTPFWKLTGSVGKLVRGTSFTIGAQQVIYAGVAPRHCGEGLANEDLVQVKATADPEFQAGDALTTVSELECIASGLEMPEDHAAAANDGDVLLAELTGLVHSVALPSFVLDGQRVITTSETAYVGGDAEEIVVGAKLEVEGLLDIVSGILVVDKVRFLEVRVKMMGPVASEDVQIGHSLRILGITVLVTPLTVDADGTISSGTANVQIEVRGFADKSSLVFASRIREKGPMNPDDVNLAGPVQGIGEQFLTVLGVIVDTRDTSLFIGPEGQGLSSEEFFSILKIGSHVEVEEGVYDGVETISSAASISIGD